MSVVAGTLKKKKKRKEEEEEQKTNRKKKVDTNMLHEEGHQTQHIQRAVKET